MIIGISGKMQSGKDTVSDIIQFLLTSTKFEGLEFKNKNFTYSSFLGDVDTSIATESGWKNVKFANKLKDCVCLILGCTRKQLEDPIFKETPLSEEWWYWKNKTGNSKFTPYNKEFIRTDHFDLVKLTPRLFMQLLGTDAGRDILHPNIWINATMVDYKPYTDGTYPNWIISDVRFPNEADAVKSKGGIMIRINRPGNDTGKHLSEIALDDYKNWKHVINNDGSIEELIDKVKEILIQEKIL